MIDERDSQFLQLYTTHRHEDQRSYYEGRMAEYEAARAQALALTSVLMALATIASLLASANVLEGKQAWALLAALLPLLSTAISAFSSLYAFEQQAKLFHDAAQALLRARAEPPEHPQIPTAAESRAALGAYVQQVEGVLRKEQGRWGQLMSEVKQAEPPGAKP